MFVSKLFGEFKNNAKFALRSLSRLVWRNPLDRVSSIEMLKNEATVFQKQHEAITMPLLEPVNLPNAQFFKEILIQFNCDYVWKLGVNENIKSLKVCSSGTALINKKLLLNLDFGTTSGILESPYKTKINKFPVVVAPWSHSWGTYYDFVIFVLAKLCRIEDALGKEIWEQAKVCYPLLNKSFEAQFLEKLGIPKDSIIDTQVRGLEIQTDCLILGNNQSWFNPSPYTLKLLRSRFCLLVEGEPQRRLFLSRRRKRRVQNEAEVRALLQEFEFEIVEEVERSVDEQIRLFSSASVVVGPHGAGLTNILWCAPGTKVIELFYGGYTLPYYYYISKILNLNYSYIVEPTKASNHWSQGAHDMIVDVNALKRHLKKVLD